MNYKVREHYQVVLMYYSYEVGSWLYLPHPNVWAKAHTGTLIMALS